MKLVVRKIFNSIFRMLYKFQNKFNYKKCSDNAPTPLSTLNFDTHKIFSFFAALEQHPTGGSIATYVLHHRSNPEWYTEIKLSLPVALDPRLHLLFQFFHISCSFDNKNKTSKPVENIVGYSWIPLLNKYRFIGGEHVLPVAATLPSGYLQIQPLGLGKGVSKEN